MDEVEEDKKALWKRLKAIKESQRLYQEILNSCPRIACFQHDNQQTGPREGIILAATSGCKLFLGKDMCKLQLQVERAMSNGIGAASAAALMRSAMSERAQQKEFAAQLKHSGPVLLRSLDAMGR